MNPLLHLMNTPDDIFDKAYTYIILISLGMIANVFYNLLSSYLRAVGNSKAPLFFLVFSACLNVGLDLFFIVVLKTGVAGAAWATNLSQGVSAVLCAGYIFLKVSCTFSGVFSAHTEADISNNKPANKLKLNFFIIKVCF